MKNLILVASLMLTTPAFAGVSWVQTPFWQTAFPTDYVARLESTDTELAAECRSFESLIFESGGDQMDTVFSTLDQLSLPSDMHHQSFYVEMRLALPSSLALEDIATSTRGLEIKKLTEQKAASDLFPRYTQNPTLVQLQEESLKGRITVEKQAKSLLHIGEKLGVKAGETKFLERGGVYSVVFSSKAAACDVLSGRANLVLKARIAVKIAFDSQRAIQAFYADIERIAIAAMTKTKSPSIRAALLGFRFGEFLSRSSAKDIAESQMLGLITQLFEVESMTPNKNWIDGVSGKALSVSGTAYDQSAIVKLVGPSVVVK